MSEILDSIEKAGNILDKEVDRKEQREYLSHTAQHQYIKVQILEFNQIASGVLSIIIILLILIHPTNLTPNMVFFFCPFFLQSPQTSPIYKRLFRALTRLSNPL